MAALDNLGTDKVLARVEDGIGWLTFNNPEKHNAMGVQMSEGSVRALDAFAADPDVRAVVLTGAGEKAFVSGADISEFEKRRANAAQAEQYESQSVGVYRAVRSMEKPTIAMIRGYCMGGGLALAAACDLRFCSEDAQFAIPAARLSIVYREDFLRWVLELVGPSHAKDILFSARRLKADEALRIGLVNRVLPAGELEGAVREYCARLVDNAPLSLRGTKLSVTQLMQDPDAREPGLIARLTAECFDSADFKEGREAFMQKRKPVWRGK
jgi:enoyl-CoA hydratase/carnithine racemase